MCGYTSLHSTSIGRYSMIKEIKESFLEILNKKIKKINIGMNSLIKIRIKKKQNHIRGKQF